MKLLILCCVLVILTLSEYGDCKRGGGGSRGGSSRKSSSGGGGWWSWGSSNNKKSSSKKGNTGTQTAPESIPKQPEVAKPSAPKNANPEPGFKKEFSNVQQSSNPQNGQQRPIGWDVPSSPGANPNGGWKSGYQGVQSGVAKPPAPKNSNPEPGLRKESANVQQSSNPQNGQQRPSGWDVPGSPGANPTGGWKNGNQGYQPHQQGQAYPQHGQSYPQNGQSYPQHGQSYPQHGQAYPQQGHGGYGGGMGGYGGNGGGMGGYGGGYGGYGGGMGGYGGGMGGFGGMGGYGGYGMQKKSGFFSGSTFRNVLTGMFIWHMTSSLLGGFQSKRPYNVYNYYNQPAVQEEIKLPANVLTMCEGNVTQLCTGSTAICTTNSTVLCVVTMSGATPCVEEKTLCVNATVPCNENDDPACRQNATTPQSDAGVAVPCLTNLTVDVNLLNETSGGGANGGQQYKYCVTTMAVGGPEYKTCDGGDEGSNDWRSVLEGSYTWNLTLPTMKRPYSVYNHHHPPGDSPSGEVALPAAVLVTCPQNATRLCAPKLTSVCTTFNEIMCLDASTSAEYCEQFNTTCLKADSEGGVLLLMPCFTNITVDANSPNFDIATLDGVSHNGGVNSSFTYHFRYCVTTLGIPGNETDVCVYGKR